jgi:hypothetical protein
LGGALLSRLVHIHQWRSQQLCLSCAYPGALERAGPSAVCVCVYVCVLRKTRRSPLRLPLPYAEQRRSQQANEGTPSSASGTTTPHHPHPSTKVLRPGSGESSVGPRHACRGKPCRKQGSVLQVIVLSFCLRGLFRRGLARMVEHRVKVNKSRGPQSQLLSHSPSVSVRPALGCGPACSRAPTASCTVVCG